MRIFKRIIFHPISIAIATYFSLLLAIKSAIDWDNIQVISLTTHAILFLLSLTASFSIISYYRSKKNISTSMPELIFLEEFDSDWRWEQYGNGTINRVDQISWSGNSCLIKNRFSDPNGGYKLIGKKITLPFIFSGWIYREDIAEGRWADRLAIEDHDFNGYGFSVSHGNRAIAIERRERGLGVANSPLYNPTPPLGSWYHFLMCFGLNGELILSIYDSSGVCLANVSWRDNKFQSFDRVVIHGGHPYYIDCLKIVKI